VAIDTPSMNLFSGTATSRDCRSTRLWSPATASSLRIGSSRRDDDQWTTCRSTTTRLRGRRRWLAQSRTRRRYPACERCQKAGCETWELAHGRGSPSLLAVACPNTLKGKRDRAILAVLLGCGLRRRELADLDFTHPMKEDVKKKILSPPLAGTRAW